MTNQLIRVFLYELRRNLRRRGYLFATLGIPLLALIGLFVFQRLTLTTFNNPAQMTQIVESLAPDANLRFGVLDLAGVIPAGFDLRGAQLYTDEAEARAALESGTIEVYYRISPDYMETGSVTAVLPRMSLNLIEGDAIRALLRRALSEGVNQQTYARLLQPSNLSATNLALVEGLDSERDEDASFVIVYVFTLVLMLSLFMTNGYLLQGLIEEKESRLIEILISTIRPVHLLMAKILALGLLGLVQIVVWIAGTALIVQLVAGAEISAALGVFSTLANIRLPVELLGLLLVYFLLAYFMFAALYGVVGAISNSMREGPQYAVIFTLPAVLPLYFLPVFISTPDGALAVILSLIPLTAPIAMTQRLVISSVPAWQIIVSLALLALTVIGVMWLAGRVFRVQTLLAGQPPKLRDLPRLLRG